MRERDWLKDLSVLILVGVMTFWMGKFSAPVKTKTIVGPERIKIEEQIVYKLDEIPLNAITAYLGVMGLDILPKNEAEKIKSQAHTNWQEGYKEGVRKGCR